MNSNAKMRLTVILTTIALTLALLLGVAVSGAWFVDSKSGQATATLGDKVLITLTNDAPNDWQTVELENALPGHNLLQPVKVKADTLTHSIVRITWKIEVLDYSGNVIENVNNIVDAGVKAEAQKILDYYALNPVDAGGNHVDNPNMYLNVETGDVDGKFFIYEQGYYYYNKVLNDNTFVDFTTDTIIVSTGLENKAEHLGIKLTFNAEAIQVLNVGATQMPLGWEWAKLPVEIQDLIDDYNASAGEIEADPEYIADLSDFTYNTVDANGDGVYSAEGGDYIKLEKYNGILNSYKLQETYEVYTATGMAVLPAESTSLAISLAGDTTLLPVKIIGNGREPYDEKAEHVVLPSTVHTINAFAFKNVAKLQRLSVDIDGHAEIIGTTRTSTEPVSTKAAAATWARDMYYGYESLDGSGITQLLIPTDEGVTINIAAFSDNARFSYNGTIYNTLESLKAAAGDNLTLETSVMYAEGPEATDYTYVDVTINAGNNLNQGVTEGTPGAVAVTFDFDGGNTTRTLYVDPTDVKDALLAFPAYDAHTGYRNGYNYIAGWTDGKSHTYMFAENDGVYFDLSDLTEDITLEPIWQPHKVQSLTFDMGENKLLFKDDWALVFDGIIMPTFLSNGGCYWYNETDGKKCTTAAQIYGAEARTEYTFVAHLTGEAAVLVSEVDNIIGYAGDVYSLAELNERIKIDTGYVAGPYSPTTLQTLTLTVDNIQMFDSYTGGLGIYIPYLHEYFAHSGVTRGEWNFVTNNNTVIPCGNGGGYVMCFTDGNGAAVNVIRGTLVASYAYDRTEVRNMDISGMPGVWITTGNEYQPGFVTDDEVRRYECQDSSKKITQLIVSYTDCITNAPVEKIFTNDANYIEFTYSQLDNPGGACGIITFSFVLSGGEGGGEEPGPGGDANPEDSWLMPYVEAGRFGEYVEEGDTASIAAFADACQMVMETSDLNAFWTVSDYIFVKEEIRGSDTYDILTILLYEEGSWCVSCIYLCNGEMCDVVTRYEEGTESMTYSGVLDTIAGKPTPDENGNVADMGTQINDISTIEGITTNFANTSLCAFMGGFEIPVGAYLKTTAEHKFITLDMSEGEAKGYLFFVFDINDQLMGVQQYQKDGESSGTDTLLELNYFEPDLFMPLSGGESGGEQGGEEGGLFEQQMAAIMAHDEQGIGHLNNARWMLQTSIDEGSESYTVISVITNIDTWIVASYYFEQNTATLVDEVLYLEMEEELFNIAFSTEEPSTLPNLVSHTSPAGSSWDEYADFITSEGWYNTWITDYLGNFGVVLVSP